MDRKGEHKVRPYGTELDEVGREPCVRPPTVSALLLPVSALYLVVFITGFLAQQSRRFLRLQTVGIGGDS